MCPAGTPAMNGWPSWSRGFSSASPSPVLTSLARALVSSLPTDPSPLDVIFHFPFSFPALSPWFFNGPPSAPLSFKPAIFYLQAQLGERRRLEQ